MRLIGLHLRVTNTITHVIQYAQQLHMPILQCFLINQNSRKPIVTEQDTANIFRKELGDRHLYIHGSYWINLVQLKRNGYSFLKNEINQAKLLGAQHFILHPGAASTTMTTEKAIDALAHVLNTVMAQEKDITFVLENTAHSYPAIGSNLMDFYYLKQKLNQPEQVRFCIDTAHAYVYGYNLVDPIQQKEFITLIDSTVGINQVALIHLNDAAHPFSSHIDKHAILGHGTIGIEALKKFALQPQLVTIPLILELPSLPYEEDNAMLHLVRSWHT